MIRCEGGWERVDHACRFCGARVLTRLDEYACSSCQARTRGGPDGICGCGTHLGPIPKTKKQIEAMRQRKPMAWHCAPNPNQGPLNPADIVIMFGDNVAKGVPPPPSTFKLAG